jgi:hypothetical protein
MNKTVLLVADPLYRFGWKRWGYALLTIWFARLAIWYAIESIWDEP